ncbi:MAG: hypothetical protein LBP75_00425 [Planctomycetota bacterium]|jgi:hypothetical protein|nr:hypothetical protein [Planctomycetota bacterium]
MKIPLTLLTLLFLAAAAAGAEILKPAEIRADVVQSANRNWRGTITKEDFVATTITADGVDTAVPHHTVVAVYYRDVDNEAWTNFLQTWQDKNYAAALTALNAVETGLRDLASMRQQFFAERVSYYRGLAYYYLRDFPNAEKHLATAAKRLNAIYKFESEYFWTRALENQGEYDKAAQRYHQFLTVILPHLAEQKPPDADRWRKLMELGRDRAQVFLLTAYPDNNEKVRAALAKFHAAAGQAPVDTVDDDLRLSALRTELRAQKYLAGKNAAENAKIVEQLREPLREAALAGDRANLGWMYLLNADANFTRWDGAENASLRRDYGEAALFDYLRVAYGYAVEPAELARTYFNLGKLIEDLRGNDWQARALLHYRRAVSSEFRHTPTYDDARKAFANLENRMRK